MSSCRHVSISPWGADISFNRRVTLACFVWVQSDPEAYYRRACQFLGITASPGVVRRMLSSAATEDSPGNTFTGKKEPMRQETQKLLDDFYNPFNQELAELLGSRDFLWLPRY